jgi:hypothetical protein
MVPLQLPLAPMRFFSTGDEHALDIASERSHDADRRQHRVATSAAQHQCLDRHLPFRKVGFLLRQFGDEFCRVLQREQLPASAPRSTISRSSASPSTATEPTRPTRPAAVRYSMHQRHACRVADTRTINGRADGLYLGGFSNGGDQGRSSFVFVENHESNGNYRNGISVVGLDRSSIIGGFSITTPTTMARSAGSISSLTPADFRITAISPCPAASPRKATAVRFRPRAVAASASSARSPTPRA